MISETPPAAVHAKDGARHRAEIDDREQREDQREERVLNASLDEVRSLPKPDAVPTDAPAAAP